jgi:DNA polymerase-1
MKKLLIFDTNAIMHHVFHGYKKSASYMTDGTPNYMLRGFHYYINTAIQEHKPDYTVFVFDPEGPTFRHEAYPEYKANRPPKDPEFKIQEPFIREYLECTGYPVITKAGFEGDDVVGTIAVRASKSPHFSDIIIYTGDKDIFQILDDKISVYSLRSKMLVKPHNILDHFKVDHLKVVDYLSLLGDKVDNVKGICGDTSAIKLVNTFNSIENIKENLHKYTAKDLGIQERYYNPIREHFDNNFESILFNKFLITLKTDIDFELTTKTISRNTHSDDLIVTYMFNKNIKIRL